MEGVVTTDILIAITNALPKNREFMWIGGVLLVLNTLTRGRILEVIEQALNERSPS